MFKVNNLIIDGFSQILNESLEDARKSQSLSVEDFVAFLQTDQGQQLFCIIDDVTTDAFIKSMTSKEYRRVRKEQRLIQDHVVASHPEMFHYFQAFADTAQHIYVNILAHLEDGTGKVELKKTDYINLLFYGTMCRLTEEVGLLLRNGYSNAALIAWRSFHEHAVVASFLIDKDSPELYQRFIDADANEQRKQVESYVKRHGDLKFPPLDETSIQQTYAEYEALKQQYESEFFKNGYNWATGYLSDPKTKPSFNAIEEEVEFSRFRPYYILASSRVHPSYRGLNDIPADGVVNLRRLIDPSDDHEDLIDPAQLTLAEFLEVNQRFLYIYSTENEYEANLMILDKLFDKFRGDVPTEGDESEQK